MPGSGYRHVTLISCRQYSMFLFYYALTYWQCAITGYFTAFYLRAKFTKYRPDAKLAINESQIRDYRALFAGSTLSSQLVVFIHLCEHCNITATHCFGCTGGYDSEKSSGVQRLTYSYERSLTFVTSITPCWEHYMGRSSRFRKKTNNENAARLVSLDLSVGCARRTCDAWNCINRSCKITCQSWVTFCFCELNFVICTTGCTVSPFLRLSIMHGPI